MRDLWNPSIADWSNVEKNQVLELWAGQKMKIFGSSSCLKFNDCQSSSKCLQTVSVSSSLPAYFHLPGTHCKFNTLVLIVQLNLTLFKYPMINAVGTIIPPFGREPLRKIFFLLFKLALGVFDCHRNFLNSHFSTPCVISHVVFR